MKSKTIVALATPPGMGALSVIRLSGPDALTIAQACFTCRSIEPRHATLGKFLHYDGSTLDEALMLYFNAPHSFTGEEVIEWSFHGSPYIAEQALLTLLHHGASMAEPGAFTQRAFLNGKLDLAQAEAVGDLIASESQASHELALRQLKGSISGRLQELRQQLIDFAALIELELDFIDEDVEFAKRDELMSLLSELQREIREMLATFKQGQAIREGIPVAIVGAPNAGKSTLLNRLLREDRAIVTDIPGTTRDSIEARFRLGPYLFRVIDTAGIRDASDQVEQLGIERTWAQIEKADIVIHLIDPKDSEHLVGQDDIVNKAPNAKLITVLTKSDLWDEAPAVSHDLAIGKESSLDELEQQILRQVDDIPQGQVLVANARHAQALQQSLDALSQAEQNLSEALSGELVAYDLRSALEHLGSITGEIVADDLLESIFSSFCIGK